MVLIQSSSFQTEEVVMPYLSTLATFRDAVRKEARALKATNILSECDKLRDDILPELGVRLEDKVKIYLRFSLDCYRLTVSYLKLTNFLT